LAAWGSAEVQGRGLAQAHVCCGVLQCVAALAAAEERKEEAERERSVLRCVAVHSSMLQCVAALAAAQERKEEAKREQKCVAVCCCVLLCVAVCCCVLLCVAVCCCVLQCWKFYLFRGLVRVLYQQHHLSKTPASCHYFSTPAQLLYM